jgi:signal transduction histidine kinase
MNGENKTKEKLLSELSIMRTKWERLEEDLKKTKDELEIQTWGLKKTNESIKLLYKELEEKNKKLQELDKLKSDFISIVSHELRTPLSITKEGISLVLDEIPGKINAKQKKVLVSAKNSIDRLARIINSLLDVSKIEAGKVELKRDIVEIAALIRQVASSFVPKAKEKGIEVKTSFSGKRIDLYVDVDRMTQVFTNLAGNALKFTEHGYIEISAREKDYEVECVVTDTGRGISKEDLPKVFSKFQQFGRINGPGEKGTGLGLSIAKGIIEMHKGRIWVESELGKGTKFIFVLPKYTTETLFHEYVDAGIKEAMKKGSKISLIMVSISGYKQLMRKLSLEKIRSILKDMKEVLDNSLRQTGDVVVKDTGEMIILLIDCGRESVIKVETRLEQQLKDYLVRQGLAEDIKLNFGCATYPDEAKSDKELIKKAKKS